MKIHKLFTPLLALVFASSVFAAVETYKIDPEHSRIGFKIRHVVSKMPGIFTQVEGTLKLDRENMANSSTEAKISPASISTNVEKRDAALKGEAFFDTAKFTSIDFVSTGAWKKTGEDSFDIPGNLTMKGVTKPVVLNARSLGFGTTPSGKQLTGWEATTTIKKSDFGVNGPAVLAKALGDEVEVLINIEAILEK